MCEVRDHSDHSGPDLPGRSNETCDRRLHWCQETYSPAASIGKGVSKTVCTIVVIGRTRLKSLFQDRPALAKLDTNTSRITGERVKSPRIVAAEVILGSHY
jgi:hypothetical protein